MNKRLPFIALLISMEWGLSQVTFGTVDIFTSFIALITLRRKDFFLYWLATTPSLVFNYLMYAGMYASGSQKGTLALVQVLLYAMVYAVWHPLAVNVIAVPWGLWYILIGYRAKKVTNQANLLRKFLKLKPRLYPEIPFVEKVKKKDFGDRVTFASKVLSLLTIGIGIAIPIGFNLIFFQMNQAMTSYGATLFTCYQLENNQTLIRWFTGGNASLTGQIYSGHVINSTVYGRWFLSDMRSVLNC